jgi:hypothetical protein
MKRLKCDLLRGIVAAIEFRIICLLAWNRKKKIFYE